MAATVITDGSQVCSADSGAYSGTTINGPINGGAWTKAGYAPGWWQVDLGDIQYVYQFQCSVPAGNYNVVYNIQISNDGTNWHQVTFNMDSNLGYAYSLTTINRYCRFIRINFIGGSSWLSCSNVVVYGRDESLPTLTYNQTKLSFNNIYYVSVDGNDTSGDGSRKSPFATLNKALNTALSGDAIIILRGIYRLNPIVIDPTYFGVGVTDYGKNLFICGENEKTILEFYGSDIGSGIRDANLFYTTGQTVISNLTFNYYPNRNNNYMNSIVRESLGLHLWNCFIENKSTKNWSYRYNNSNNANTPVVNCTFKSNGYSTSDYSGAPVYYNCLFDRMPSDGAKYNCINRTVTSNDLKISTMPSDIAHKGSTILYYNNPDNSVNNIGVVGGSLQWTELYNFNLPLFYNTSFGEYNREDSPDGLNFNFKLGAVFNIDGFYYKITKSTGEIIVDYGELTHVPCDVSVKIPIDKMTANEVNIYKVYFSRDNIAETQLGTIYLFLSENKYIVFYKTITTRSTMPVIKSNGVVMVSLKGQYSFMSAAISTDNINYHSVPVNRLYQMPRNFQQIKIKLFMTNEAIIQAYGIACL